MDHKRWYLWGLCLYAVGVVWLLATIVPGFAPVKYYLPGCLFRRTTHIPCPACGTTSALDALLHERWAEALLLNPLSYPFLIVLVAYPMWWLYDVYCGTNTMYTSWERLIAKPWVLILGGSVLAILWGWKLVPHFL